MRPRPTIRLRLTALYALLVFLAGGLLLAVSYALLDGHLHDTLRDRDADAVLRDLQGSTRWRSSRSRSWPCCSAG